MGNYTLLGRADLAHADARIASEPFGSPGLAILDDGSFFASVWIEVEPFTSVGYTYILRMWHLASDLSVLGTSDVTYPEYFLPYAVPAGNMKVLSLLSYGNGTPVTMSSIIDCSGPVPVAGPSNVVSTVNTWLGNYGSGGVFQIVDTANHRVIIASLGAVQVFDLLTGSVLGELAVSFSNGGPLAFVNDVANPTQFTVTTNGPNSSIQDPIQGWLTTTKNWEFIITTAGVVTLNRTYVVNGVYAYSLGAGALKPEIAMFSQEYGPTISAFSGTSDLSTTNGRIINYYEGMTLKSSLDLGTYTQQYSHWSASTRLYDGIYMRTGSDGYVNTTGPSDTLGGGRYLFTFYEHGKNNDYTGWTEHLIGSGVNSGSAYTIHPTIGGADTYRLRMMAVDRQNPTDPIEVIDLDYFDQPLPISLNAVGYSPSPPDGDGNSLWRGSYNVVTNQESGIMLVGAGVVDQNIGKIYTLMVWAIQGPADKPNLNGGPLGVDVRFLG